MRAMKEKFAEQQLLLTDCRKRKRGKAVVKTNKKRRIRKSEVAGLGPIIEHESSTHRYPLRRRRRAHKKPSGRHTFFDSLNRSTDVNMCPGFSTKMDFI